MKLTGLMQLGLLAGPLLTMVDSSIVNVAAPDIATELHTGLADTQWVVSGYLLALAAGLTATSYLARRFGTMRVYAWALAGFVAASVLCAAAPGIWALVAARALQGLAGAPLVPLAMSVLLGQGAARRIPVAAGLLFFLAPALGPSLGGLLIAAGGWRWIFLVNLPIGLLALLGLRRVPPELAPAGSPAARPDPVGLLLLATGLVAALAHAVVLGAVPLLLYVLWARHTATPAVDLALLRHRRSALALVLSVVSSVVAFAAVFLLPIFTESVQHHTALATGLALLPQGLITGLGTAAGARLADRYGVRLLVCAGFLLLALASCALLLLTPATPLWATAAILSGRAAAIGFGITPLLSVMLEPLTDSQLADGNTLFNIAQRLGGSLGVGVLGSLLATRAVRVGAVAAFHEIGLILTALALLAALLALPLPRRLAV
ncbi:MFS transporter [Dactylosporangium sp. CS-047395]|uniref:MFS transporter n=1 Tax=Dactylosporangium sp. CS-047395 TaxID=3239936 RepID=UPI003D8BDCC9